MIQPEVIKRFSAAASRAVAIEGANNLRSILLSQAEDGHYSLSFILRAAPTEADLEAISILHTEVAADVWQIAETLHYDWTVTKPDKPSEKVAAVIYDGRDRSRDKEIGA